MRKFLIPGAAVVVCVALFLLSLPMILHSAGLHPDYDGQHYQASGKRALVITTSHDRLSLPGEDEGEATGVFGSDSRTFITPS